MKTDKNTSMLSGEVCEPKHWKLGQVTQSKIGEQDVLIFDEYVGGCPVCSGMIVQRTVTPIATGSTTFIPTIDTFCIICGRSPNEKNDENSMS